MKHRPTRFFQDLAREQGIDYNLLKKMRKDNPRLSLTQLVDLIKYPPRNSHVEDATTP